MRMQVTSALAVLVAMWGCSSGEPDGGAPMGDPGDGADAGPGGPGNDPVDGGEPEVDCEDATAAAEGVLTQYCAGCHGGGEAVRGGFGVVLDAAAMRGNGKVVPYDRQASPIYVRPERGAMPPAGRPAPNEDEIEAIGTWIDCGAPDFEEPPPPPPPERERIDIESVLTTISDDLARIPNAADRRRQRYLSLVHLYNANVSDAVLDRYLGAVSMLLNSLSTSAEIALPTVVDPDRVILRIDLADYDWDAATWNRIVAGYPYEIRYDRDSPVFPVNEQLAEQIRTDSDTNVPIVQADWFAFHTMRAPLYQQTLGLRGNINAIAQDFGVDIADDIASRDVQRAGFAASDVAFHNRVVERHAMAGSSGAFWLAYDFDTNVGADNIFTDPVGLEPDLLTAVFTLPNGLVGYAMGNDNGVLIEEGPSNVVADTSPYADEPTMRGPVSCTGCHDGAGVIEVSDQVQSRSMAVFTGRTLDGILALYPGQNAVKDLIEVDSRRYQNARDEALGPWDAGGVPPMRSLEADHDAPLDLVRAAETLAVSPELFRDALVTNSGAYPPEISSLRLEGTTVPRDAFDQAYAATVCALSIGDVCEPGGVRCGCP